MGMIRSEDYRNLGCSGRDYRSLLAWRESRFVSLGLAMVVVCGLALFFIRYGWRDR